MNTKIISAVLLCLVLTPPTILAQAMTLEVIPLQHRMSDEVVQLLRPLVSPGGTITGMNNQLIIKTTPDNLAEIKKVLQSLDRSPRRLMVTVKQDVGGVAQRRDDAVSGRVTFGDVTVSSDPPFRTRDGLAISAGDGDGNVIRYGALEGNTRVDDQNTSTVQVLEGHHAFIQSGQSVPITNRTSYLTPHGVITRDNTEYHDATSGFYVLPRLNGDRVTLLVAPHLASVRPGGTPVFDVQNVETTASGLLGEWMRIGGIDRGVIRRDAGNLSSSQIRGQESRSVLIKVDEIR